MAIFQKFRKWISVLIPIIAFTGLGVMLFHYSTNENWKTILSHRWLFLAATALCTMNALFTFFVWHLLLNREGTLLNFSSGYRLYNVSSLTKYLPLGTVWQMASYFHLGENPQVKVAAVISAILSILFGLQGGAFVALPQAGSILPSDGHGIIFWLMACWLTLLTVLSWRCGWLSRPLSWLTSNWANISLPQNIRFGPYILLNFLNILGWIAQGLACVYLLQMVHPNIPVKEFWYLASCLYVACIFGYFSFLTPSGLGVREGVLVFLLNGKLSAFETVFVTLNFRLCLTLADLFFSVPFLFSLIYRRRMSPSMKKIGKAA